MNWRRAHARLARYGSLVGCRATARRQQDRRRRHREVIDPHTARCDAATGDISRPLSDQAKRDCTGCAMIAYQRSHRRGHWFDPSIAHERPRSELWTATETRAFDGRGSRRASRGRHRSGCPVRVVIVCQRARDARRVVRAPGVDVQQTPAGCRPTHRGATPTSPLRCPRCATPRTPASAANASTAGTAPERHDPVHVYGTHSSQRPGTPIFGHSHSGESRSSVESSRWRSGSSRGGGPSFVEAAGHRCAWSRSCGCCESGHRGALLGHSVWCWGQ